MAWLAGEADGLTFRFEGDWAFVERDGDSITRAQVVNGKAFRFGDVGMEGAGEWAGEVDAVEIEDRRIVVSSRVPLAVDGSLTGRTIVIAHPDYICNSSYEITDIETADEGRYRISVDRMDFLLSEGRITGVDGATLLTDTPMLKLEVRARPVRREDDLAYARTDRNSIEDRREGNAHASRFRRGVVVFGATILHLRRRAG